MNEQIANIRRDYKLKTLDEQAVALNPIDQFSLWWDEAIASDIDEVNAMTLATIHHNQPEARIVLLKSFDEKGFVFFTNYASAKGKAIAENPLVSLVFFWKELERQVRINGKAEKLDPSISDAYFKTRPLGSRIGAWASTQSSVIANRAVLEAEFEKLQMKFMNDAAVPRPPHWGGYLVKPYKIEFWQGRSSRLHDRILYSLQENNQWKIERLAP